MAMSGLGGVDELWAAPFHYYVSLRNDYIVVINPPKDDVSDQRQVAPGVTLETIRRHTR